MQARYRGGDREPESGPRPPGTGLVRAVKRLEEMRQLILGQRQAGVLDRETQASCCGRRCDHDAAAVRRELDGVIEQLLDAPADPVELAADERVHVGGNPTRGQQAAARVMSSKSSLIAVRRSISSRPL